MAGFVTYFFVGGSLLVTFILNGKASNGAWNFLFATQLMRTAVLMQYPLPAPTYSYLTEYTKVLSAFPDFFANKISEFIQTVDWKEGFEVPLDRYQDYGIT